MKRTSIRSTLFAAMTSFWSAASRVSWPTSFLSSAGQTVEAGKSRPPTVCNTFFSYSQFCTRILRLTLLKNRMWFWVTTLFLSATFLVSWRIWWGWPLGLIVKATNSSSENLRVIDRPFAARSLVLSLAFKDLPPFHSTLFLDSAKYCAFQSWLKITQSTFPRLTWFEETTSC